MTISNLNKGRFASTEYKILKEFEISNNNYISLIKCKLNTGRTHQIRVHMSHIGLPLIGDKLYGRQKIEKVKDEKLKNFLQKNFINTGRQALHAKKLGFYHPVKKERVTFETNLPTDLQRLIKALNDNNE